jgi:hypothetical protein
MKERDGIMKRREGIVEHIGIGIESIGNILVCIMCNECDIPWCRN